jgi:tetratricopeptide (TPR) repeat protein
MNQLAFDAQEYIHLALHASAAGNAHACMTYLKDALRQEPDNATALYLLAVQHAEIGLTERAISGMRAALEIAPALEIARFQLGLLLVDRNALADARGSFGALQMSDDAALRSCSIAMIAVCDGEVLLAREKLTQALSSCNANAALSDLMRRMLERLPLAGEERPVDLGAYRLAGA